MTEPAVPRLPWKSQVARRLFESYLPGIHELNREMTRASAVASVWLVTLTTGLLALLLSNAALLGSPDELGRRILLGLAIVVVGTGVVYRMLSVYLDRLVSLIQRQVTTILAADGSEALDPSEPDLIVDLERLEEAYYELVGRPLPTRSKQVPFQQALGEYGALYEIYTAAEEKAIRSLERQVGAAFGISAAESVGMLKRSEALLGDGEVAPIPVGTGEESDSSTDALRKLVLEADLKSRSAARIFNLQLIAFFGVVATVAALLW